MHKLLERQLRRAFGDAAAAPESLRPLIEAVDEAYVQADRDRGLLERSMDLASKELLETNRRLLGELEARRRAEEEKRTLWLLQSTVDSIDEGILVVDAEGATVLRNARLRALWGLADAPVGDDAAALLFCANDRLEDAAALVRLAKRAGQDSDATLSEVLRFRDGRTVEVETLPRRMDGAAVGRIWCFRDITRRRALEDQLRQASKMEAIGKLAGGVAHDFNNLLTVMTGYGELVLQGLPTHDPLRPRVNEILGAAQKATHLTRQLLAFSRKQDLQPEVLDLNAVVASIEGMARRLIGEDIVLDTKFDPGVGPVRADRGQMEQVLLNLLVNSQDAQPRGGAIRIFTADVVLGGSRAPERPGRSAASEDVTREALPFVVSTAGRDRPAVGRYARLSVEDRGTGMSAEVMSHLFEPFFTTKEKGKGTGLGLSTVYGIVHQSGGFLEVESRPGEGSTFHVHLPVVEASARSAPAPEAPDVERGHEVVLLVEDEEDVAKLVALMLHTAGYTVLRARDGRDALRVAERHDGVIAALVTDVVMPAMGGVELAAALHAARPGLPVLFISGYTGGALSHRDDRVPDAAILQKPFNQAQLTAKLREVIGKR